MRPDSTRTRQDGQAALLLVVGLSVFLIAALALAFDGALLYAHHQMAQAAADAASLAGTLSLLDGTNASGAAPFGVGNPPPSFTCSAADARTPCVYARANGFGATASDTVTIDFPTTLPGVTLSSDPVPVVRATVQRTVRTALMGLFSLSTSGVQSVAGAGIVTELSRPPLIVTHPTLSPALDAGSAPVRVCGGPLRSIQVNSNSAAAVSLRGVLDLSRAGPADPGDCTTGTGGDLGVFGGPSSAPAELSLGTTGHYIQPASPILDPYTGIAAPSIPAAGVMTVTSGDGCPVAECDLYGPGLYANIKVKNATALFKPGLYYVNGGGFEVEANGQALMAAGFPPSPDTGAGMVVYNTGAGAFHIHANGTATLAGADAQSAYQGILFFEDRNAPALTHSLGGGGTLTLTGSIYLANSLATMQQTASHYQTLNLGGNAAITLNGFIVVNALALSGASQITFNLSAAPSLAFRRAGLLK